MPLRYTRKRTHLPLNLKRPRRIHVPLGAIVHPVARNRVRSFVVAPTFFAVDVEGDVLDIALRLASDGGAHALGDVDVREAGLERGGVDLLRVVGAADGQRVDDGRAVAMLLGAVRVLEAEARNVFGDPAIGKLPWLLQRGPAAAAGARLPPAHAQAVDGSPAAVANLGDGIARLENGPVRGCDGAALDLDIHTIVIVSKGAPPLASSKPSPAQDVDAIVIELWDLDGVGVMLVLEVVVAVALLVALGAGGLVGVGAGPEEGVLGVLLAVVHVLDVDEGPAREAAAVVVGHGVELEPGAALDRDGRVVRGLVLAQVAARARPRAVLAAADAARDVARDRVREREGLVRGARPRQRRGQQRGRARGEQEAEEVGVVVARDAAAHGRAVVAQARKAGVARGAVVRARRLRGAARGAPAPRLGARARRRVVRRRRRRRRRG